MTVKRDTRQTDPAEEDVNGHDIAMMDRMLDATPKERLQCFEKHMAFVRKIMDAKPVT